MFSHMCLLLRLSPAAATIQGNSLAMRRSASVSIIATLLVIMLTTALKATPAAAATKAAHFKLANGMLVVVIPDHRAPVVTHMVWYRTGAADEPPGTSGIAHFLEHLMFKSTDKMKSGEFSKVVASLGGQDNAFTAQDATAYHQRIAKAHLRKMMEMEADRMVGLRLGEREVRTERDVIIEERRTRTDNNPSAILDEQMAATLFYNHPYRNPVIGWKHEMAALSREDAITFYKRFYAPNNSILIVAGDVTPDEVRKLARATYGKIPPTPEVTARPRPSEPPHTAPRRISYSDPRAGRYSLRRYYLSTSYNTAKPGEAEALDLLMKIAGGGATSRLYRTLVVEKKLAASAGGWFAGSGRDSGRIGVYAVAANGVSLEKLEAGLDAVLDDIRKNGVTAKELARAKKSYLADYVYEADNPTTMARRYGWALVVGLSVEDVEAWPDRISKVTVKDIKDVARRHFDIRKSVTGWLMPESKGKAAAKRFAPKKS